MVTLLSLGRDSVAGTVRGKSRGRLQEWIILSVLKKTNDHFRPVINLFICFLLFFSPL